MTWTVHPIALPGVNAYLVRGPEGLVLVDTGWPGMERQVLAALRRANWPRVPLWAILLTHFHVDHRGNAARLRELTGAPVVLAPQGVVRAQGRGPQVPPGRDRIGRWMARTFRLLSPLLPPSPVRADLALGPCTDLAFLGLPGARWIPTPGHTPDSHTLLLPDGQALVGDAVLQSWRRQRVLLPHVLEDLAAARESLRRLEALPLTTVYPGHGRPFPAERLSEAWEDPALTEA